MSTTSSPAQGVQRRRRRSSDPPAVKALRQAFRDELAEKFHEFLEEASGEEIAFMRRLLMTRDEMFPGNGFSLLTACDQELRQSFEHQLMRVPTEHEKAVERLLANLEAGEAESPHFKPQGDGWHLWRT